MITYYQCFCPPDIVIMTELVSGGRTCSADQFTCREGQCIPREYRCDHVKDCVDNSDENNCNSDSRDCYPGEWGCPGSTMCIPLNKVCDDKPDCPGGTDETNSTAGQTCLDRCSTLSCEFLCHPSPQGGTCYCPDGFIVANDSRSCTDYNDCQIWGICDQLCEDRPGTHHCSCTDGYVLEQGHACKANVSGNRVTLVAENLQSPHGLALDPTVGWVHVLQSNKATECTL
uniref:EGF-like domain-containing protein n=1 Tax=Oryzias latipes TaxID=8090 RepID=A0A3B3I0X5_ORYLA